MKPREHFEPNLVIQEIHLPQGGEWRPRGCGWCVLHFASGLGYWHEQSGTREAPSGSTLVLSAQARGVARASQLTDVDLAYFCVETEKLPGLLSVREQHDFKQAAGRQSLAVRMLPPDSPLSARFKDLRAMPASGASSARLRLLQFFMDLFDWGSDQGPAAPAPWMGGKERFRQIMNQMPASEFVQLSVSDLAPMMSCSPRHLNRLFRKELGGTFREKQIELRLAKACELLATSNAKVVEVALESGYQSSSVFSEMFKRRFGVSPGQWRRQESKARGPSRLYF